VNDLPIIKFLLFPPRESCILTRISREFVKSSKDDAYALGTRDILCYSFWVWNFLWCLHLSKKDISRYFASFDHILPRLVVWETSAVEILMTLSTQFTRLKHSLVQSLLNSWPGQGIDTMEHFAVRGTYSCRMTQQSHSYLVVKIMVTNDDMCHNFLIDCCSYERECTIKIVLRKQFFSLNCIL